MEQAGRQRALLAVVGALSLSGLACTERVPLISTVTQLDAGEEPEDAYVRPDRAMRPDVLEPDGGGPRDSGRDVHCWDFTQGHRLDLQYPEVVIALDRSYSMLVEPRSAMKTWWTVARQELMNYMRENDGAMAFGYAEFPGRISCDPNFGCCTRMPVSPSLDSHDGIEHEWQCGSPQSCQTSDDSPSGHVLSRIRAQYDSDTDPMPYRYVLLVTDGPPSCQDEPDECGIAGRQAARLFSNLAIETMVLPLGTAARDDACLNSVAVMGHTRDPGATTFPWVSDPGQMSAQLRTLMARVEERVCRFYVNGEIKNRDSLSVTVDFKPLPRDPKHVEGWDFDPAADREIQVYGSACKKLRCQQLDARDFRSEEACTQCGQNVTCR